MRINSIAHARHALNDLRAQVSRADIGLAAREWGGANVLVVTASRGAHYREVITKHASSVSWMFERLRDAFADVLDSCSKFEFYGRLQSAVEDLIQREPESSAAELCMTLVGEADVMLHEIVNGEFRYLTLAIGVEIAADKGGRR